MLNDARSRAPVQVSFDEISWTISTATAPSSTATRATPARRRTALPVVEAPHPALPRTRAQCSGAGTCPKLGCRSSTVVEVDGDGRLLCYGGAARAFVSPTRGSAAQRDLFDAHVIARLELATYTCVLDFVAAHPDGADRETVGAALGCGAESVRVEEERAIAKILASPEGRDLWRALTGQAPDVDGQIDSMQRSVERLARREADLDPTDLGVEVARKVAREMRLETTAALGVLIRRRQRRAP